jgi:nucleoside-diphosphate kinase
MIEKTLVLLKPDAVQRGLIGEIITRFEKCGLKIIAMKMVYADKDLAGKHYEADEDWLKSVGEKSIKSSLAKGLAVSETDPIKKGLRVRDLLLDYITMSPVVALVIEGHGAVCAVRKIVGGTNPQDSAPGTIRGDYTIDSYTLADNSERSLQNLIHASDAVKQAEKEIKLWFKDEDIHVWKRVGEDLIYRNLK